MTTTKAQKVKNPSKFRPRKTDRSSFYRDLAAEMQRLTHKAWDPGYLSNLVTGAKLNKTLIRQGTLAAAIANLEARTQNITGDNLNAQQTAVKSKDKQPSQRSNDAQ